MRTTAKTKLEKLKKKIHEMTPVQAAQLAFVALIGFILLAVLVAVSDNNYGTTDQVSRSGSSGSPAQYQEASRRGMAQEESGGASSPAPMDSNVASDGVSAGSEIPVEELPTGGNDAEDFEVTEYSADIRTRAFDEVCGALAELKPLEYVIFEEMTRRDDTCVYRFKVEHAHAGAVLDIVEGFDPQTLTERTFTIKRQVEDTTTAIDIFQRKQDALQETLDEANVAYDQVRELASAGNNAEVLADVIESQVHIIERLTEKQVRVTNQLERLRKRRALQLDRLDYTFFTVSVEKEEYVDWQGVKDSWKDAVRDLIATAHKTLQIITVYLLAFILVVAQFAVYILLLIFIAKYALRFVKSIWKK